MKAAKILIITVIIILILFDAVYIPVRNNMIASSVSKKLRNTPLPEKTILVDYTTKAGKLTGSGNGMQYLGVILLKSELSLEAMDNYYSQYRENDWSFLVSEQKSSHIEFIEHGSLEFDNLKKFQDLEGYYIVYSWGESNNSLLNLDLRGH